MRLLLLALLLVVRLVFEGASSQAAPIETVAGDGQPGPSPTAGRATELHVDQPFGVEIGPDGALYVTEVGQHQVRRVDLRTGQMTTVAGCGRKGYSGDGGPATAAEMNEPYEVRFDRAGNTLIVERLNHLIRRVDRATGQISTVAGTGKAGFGGDGGLALQAQFHEPHSIVLDADDNIYVADILNHRIRRIDSRSGKIDTIAGSGEKRLPIDGRPARGQPIFGPRALFVEGNDLWVALREGNSIWRTTLDGGPITHLAGTGKKGYTGDGGPALDATFDGPKGIALGPDHALYIVDTEAQAIRRLDVRAARVTTVAGAGPTGRGFNGDGTDATLAWLGRPHGVCIDKLGNVYIGDTENHRVRRVVGVAAAEDVVSRIRAQTRGGQVFIRWDERDTPPQTSFNVYASNRPIDDLAKTRLVAHHVEPHSARDWWGDPASFDVKAQPATKPVGWRLEPLQERIDPQGGLFVHTVRPTDAGPLYFAVTMSDSKGTEDQKLVAGQNRTTASVQATLGPIGPIWQRDTPQPAVHAEHDRPLWLQLHAKGGVIRNKDYVLFGDETMGWRPGLPFGFSVGIERGEVVVRPNDRNWINRPHSEAADSGTPTIWSFWFGYNSKIYDRSAMASGVPTPYTERRLLWLLDWVDHRYGTDRARWYCSGSSMGGCGTLSFGLRHPELFAALYAHVPIVSYTYAAGPRGSASRLEPCCWIGPIAPDFRISTGEPLLERMNSSRFVGQTKDDLPPLFVLHGRNDLSIPWVDNPPFYRAMQAARQPVFVWWDEGTHATSGKELPADVKAWSERFRQFRHDESYVVFTGASIDRNPGDGRATDGDPVGWLNRGLDWRDVHETSDEYAVTLTASLPDVAYPVRTDITLRRLQRFHPRPGTRLGVSLDDQPASDVVVPAEGPITIRDLPIASPEGTRLTLRTKS